jgi:hypothetical protein
MVEKMEKRSSVMINRAPVLTLWAAVVAEMLDFEYDEAFTLGRAVAGLNAYSKGVALGLFQPAPRAIKEQRQKLRRDEVVTVNLLHRAFVQGVRRRVARAKQRRTHFPREWKKISRGQVWGCP